MRDRKPSKIDRTRDPKRAPKGPKSKSATLARKAARTRKHTLNGRASS